MTIDDAMKIVERQTAMLASIHQDQSEARIRIRDRLRLKIQQGHGLDTLEFRTAQDFGLLTSTGETT